MNPSYGVARLTAIHKRVQENNQGEIFLLKDDEKVITFPFPRPKGQVEEINYIQYDFEADVTDFVIFFRDYSDQHVVFTFSNNSIALISYNESFDGTYKAEHVLHRIDIDHQVLFTRGYQAKINNQLQDFIIVIDRNSDGINFLRQYQIRHL